MAEAARTWRPEGSNRTTTSGEHSRETPLPRAATFQAAVVLMLWCVARALMADAWATPLERVEFESASQRLLSGALIPGDRIQGYLAKPDGAGPFPAVVGLHGCAGMHDTTKQKLADELVARGYAILLVDSYATRGIDHACTSSAFATFLRRRPDAYGALVFLARQTFVDPHRVAAVGFSAALGLPSLWRSPIRSNRSSLQATCGSGRRLRFILHASRQWRVRGYPRSSSSGPSTTGRRRQTAPIKSPAGATTGRQSSSLSIPARPWILLPAPPARHDLVRSLAGIQRRGSGRCKSPPAPVSRSPPQLKACR